ncbi:uncharacterized protein BX663DRAFT_451440 [Cokeromyces recurvatus]|uniref:uncharacterized protein n=1 Tax=Cokeromyces recurvatus TaxID=90255 RepID=UPI00221FE2B8|nr:uncharacterized protein BX663DRAFT_451440 [Cokeromyces recurvatus]KAI7904777.1 hypothetical protein BX663DRAFT_451440 [Cokeromyces recurvatus]
MSNSNDDDDIIPLKQHALQLEIRTDPIRGRGVFTKERITKNTLVEISPILFFNSKEYEEHGRFTVLDHYTYCWPGGFGLALGLGSMFNHDSSPNVGFIRDIPNKLIRYVTLRDIEKEEELCISYGNHLWFEDNKKPQEDQSSESEDEPFPFADD